MGQEIGYCAGNVGVSDVKVTEFGEFGDGLGDWANEVGSGVKITMILTRRCMLSKVVVSMILKVRAA